jgi:hypothetical protein
MTQTPKPKPQVSKPTRPVSQNSSTPEIDQIHASTPRDQPEFGVKPEQISLSAHKHIQNYLGKNGLDGLSANDLSAVMRLSQHLRVFGLLSATGYINQSNAREGEVRKRTVPVWSILLGQLMGESDPKKLMQKTETIARENPHQYMAIWQRALLLSNYWNFWARAYQLDQEQ